MRLRIVFLLSLAALLTACGLDQVKVLIGEPTAESPFELQVDTVVAVGTPISAPERVDPPAPIQAPEMIEPPEPISVSENTLSESSPTEPVDDGGEAGAEDGAASAPRPSLPSGSWQAIIDLPRYINDLVVDPQNPQLLYAGTGSSGSGSGVYKSEDGGLIWQFAAYGLPSEDVAALAISFTQPPTLYALVGVRGDIYASSDNAQNWTHLGNSGLFGGFEHWMQADPVDSNMIFALAKSSDLVRSSDGGSTWLSFGEGLPSDEHSIHVMSLAIDPTDSNIIYAGTGGHVGGGHGVYKSTDGGQTWTAVNRGMLDYRISALVVDPAFPQTVYAGADDGAFFKTSDGGQTWTNLSDKLPLPRDSYPAIRKISISPPETIFLLADRAGVFVSRDGGQVWQALGNPGGADGDFSTMIMIPGSELTLVVGSARDGGWRYSAE